jgi:drug/metabolite transporter (DMT)-like permease
LIAQHLTHQHAELMHIFAQGEVLRGKLNLLSIHGARFYLAGYKQWHADSTMNSPQRQKLLVGFAMAGAGAILFAGKGLFSKALFATGVDHVTLTAVRAVLALPLFAALAIQQGISFRRASFRTLAKAAAAGIFCYGLGATIDFRALELIDISLERALLFTYPALIVAWFAFTRRTYPERATLLALGLTYAGILLVVGVMDPALWRQNLMGSLMVLFCASTTATYFLVGERTIPELGSSGFTIVAMTAAAVAVSLYFLATRPLSAITELSPHQWLLLGAMAILGMFLPTLFQAEGIKRLGAQHGSLASTIGPPAAMALGMAFLDESPTSWQLLGTGLILAGIVVIAPRLSKRASSVPPTAVSSPE